MGLLSPSDWKGDWIGAVRPSAQVPSIGSASWIWSDNRDLGNGDALFWKEIPAGQQRWFRSTFTPPTDALLTEAIIEVAADNEFEVWINGEKVQSIQSGWEAVQSTKVGSFLRPETENTILIRAGNHGNSPNPAALIAALTLPIKDAAPSVQCTDAGWAWTEGSGDWLPSNNADWKGVFVIGKWGSAPYQKSQPSATPPVLPLFRHEFDLPGTIRRATVHVSGLGHYVLSANGKKVGDGFLDPAWSVYEKSLFYNTHDVTDLLKSGRNAFGLKLGKGFYNTQADRRVHGVNTNNPLMLRLQMAVEFVDGTSKSIVTGEDWKWTEGPLTHNSILGGDDYDARKLPEDWDRSGFDDSEWKNAVKISHDLGELKAAIAPSMASFEVFQPVSVDEPTSGLFVYTFGQNAAATLRVKVVGEAGRFIRFKYGEQRHSASEGKNDGTGLVDQSGVNHGYFGYTLKGGGTEEWFSDLFYTGFQYIEVEGAVPSGYPNPEQLPVIEAIESVHVRADLPHVGHLETSNSMINRIDRMVDWAIRSNLAHVLTDCPHREKLGWLEVPWLMWASVASRNELSRFGPKVAADIRDSQAADGRIPTVAPNYPTFSDGFAYTPEWGAAGVFIPWYVYQWYGDERALASNYSMMKRFVDYMHETSDDLVPIAGLGDWYDYGHGKPVGPSRFTPLHLTAMATFAECTRVVSSAAQVLGHTNDSKKYDELHARIRARFNEKFYKGGGEYQNSGSPQTANAMALVFNLVPDADREKTADAIVEDMRERGWMQTSGDVGFRFLLRALADSGNSDAIFRMLARSEKGGYQWLVDSGWTTLPESWDAERKSSHNHCMLGHIHEWFSLDLLGIRPRKDSVAFQHFEIAPTPGSGIDGAKGHYHSPYGRIEVAWAIQQKEFVLDVHIPPNSRAHIYFPPGIANPTEDGLPAESVKGIVRVDSGKDRVVYQVSSGAYRFRGDQAIEQ